VRVLHFTDLHLYRRPSPSALFSKRLLGTANLYLGKRVHHFSQRSIELLVEAVVEQRPDLCVCSGDLTGMSSPDEYRDVRALLAPVIDHIPTVMVPGNHDVYTRGAQRERRFEGSFAAWTGGGSYPAVHRHGPVTVVGLDCARPHPILANGELPEEQLEGLARLIDAGELDQGFTILLLHYPLRDRQGEPYATASRNLLNAASLEAILSRRPAIDLILHGHEHHGFESHLVTPHGDIPIHDPGAGGRTPSAERNETAHFNVYTIGEDGLEGVERFALEGERFELEDGGPYTSGR